MHNIKGYILLIFLTTVANFISAQRSNSDVNREAKRISKELRKNPELFCDYALKHSNDKNSKDSCGLYDWSPKSKYLKELIEHFEVLKPMEISKPIVTSKGVYVIQKIAEKEENIKFNLIFLRYTESPEIEYSKEVVKTANSISKSLKKDPTLFCDYVSKYSKDKASIENCGLYDWAPKKHYVKELISAFELLDDNEISKPIKSQYGMMIIQRIGAREEEIKFKYIVIK